MIYLLLNADEFLATQQIQTLKAAMGAAEMADLNTTTLEGAVLSVGDLLGQASMMPFLAERRLVIAKGLLTGLDRRLAASKGTASSAHNEAAQLLGGLATLSDTTDLVLLEEKALDKRRHLWKGYTQEGETARTVTGVAGLIAAGQITLSDQSTPDARQVPGWISQRARANGFAIDGRAIQMLATYVGPNLRQLDNELNKLAAYASGRAISADDVKLLVADASEAIIWNLTDALSQRNGRSAMQTLHELRRGDANPFYLLTMIARQFRIIIKVKEGLQGGARNEFDIAKEIKESPFPVKKAMGPARSYSFDELEQIMAQLLAADMAMKTGADAETELDLLIAELTTKPASRR